MSDTNEPVITLARGDSLKLSFTEAASGGYQWLIDAPKGLFITTPREATPRMQHEYHMIGGPIKKTFMIMGEQSGTYDLTFEHKRPWEDKPIGTHRVRIQVR